MCLYSETALDLAFYQGNEKSHSVTQKSDIPTHIGIQVLDCVNGPTQRSVYTLSGCEYFFESFIMF
jgi:hypothetical protein